MSVPVPVTAASVSLQNGDVMLYTWALTTATPDGIPISFVEWADRTWQASGAFGGTGVCTFQGSNDGTNWFTMTNAAGGAAATLSAAGGLSTIELPLWVRPNLTTPGTAAAVNVTCCARRQPWQRS